MNRETLKAAVEAAKKFIAAADDVELNEHKWLIIGTRETGTVRRASMELTRALTDMRKPN